MEIGKVYVHTGDGQRARFLNKASLEFLPQRTIYNTTPSLLARNGSVWIPEDEYTVSKILKKYGEV